MSVFSTTWWSHRLGLCKDVKTSLPGMTIYETKYFNKLLDKKFCSLTEKEWKELNELNIKMLLSTITRY